jgi:aspartyl-tRNA(Asn)/glutamyl-tRNA(Gln) amidotransferase subunit B
VQQAIQAAVALNCQINRTSWFDRKHYFYQDLPLGYQITQQRKPIALNGLLSYFYSTDQVFASGKTQRTFSSLLQGKVRVERVQIEQDSGKSIHDMHESWSLVDLNRAGSALIEVVFAPDLSSPYQAAGVLLTVQEIFRHLNVCDGNMEDGSMRCDVNVSVQPSSTAAATAADGHAHTRSKRVEIKNLNSIQRIIMASTYEINRQISLLDAGQVVDQETRGYDLIKGETFRLRTKEIATDYRYFPDPDLPPLHISYAHVEEIKKNMPELPQAIISRYLSIGLDDERIHFLLARTAAKAYFDQVWSSVAIPEKSALSTASEMKSLSNLVYHWMASELLGYLNSWQLSYENSPISAIHFAELLQLLYKNRISNTQAKMVLSRLFYGLKDNSSTALTAESIAQSLGFLASVQSATVKGSDDCTAVRDEIYKLCNESVKDPRNAANLNKYRSGQDRLLNYFLGDVMKRSKGRYDPKLVRSMLIEVIKDTTQS